MKARDCKTGQAIKSGDQTIVLNGQYCVRYPEFTCGWFFPNAIPDKFRIKGKRYYIGDLDCPVLNINETVKEVELTDKQYENLPDIAQKLYKNYQSCKTSALIVLFCPICTCKNLLIGIDNKCPYPHKRR